MRQVLFLFHFFWLRSEHNFRTTKKKISRRNLSPLTALVFIISSFHQWIIDQNVFLSLLLLVIFASSPMLIQAWLARVSEEKKTINIRMNELAFIFFTSLCHDRCWYEEEKKNCIAEKEKANLSCLNANRFVQCIRWIVGLLFHKLNLLKIKENHHRYELELGTKKSRRRKERRIKTSFRSDLVLDNEENRCFSH